MTVQTAKLEVCLLKLTKLLFSLIQKDKLQFVILNSKSEICILKNSEQDFRLE